MNWSGFLDSFGHRILKALGEDSSWLPTGYNPITQALKDESFVEKYRDVEGFSRMGLSRVATVCQMVVFDASGGPEGDRKPKALRRHWYSWYKVHFAQPLARQMGDTKPNAQGIEEMDDKGWAGRLSQTYAAFVDSGEITYKDLWVEDASRMMSQNWATLFQGCHIILAVEKDSLFGDFKAAAKALGARAVYSGKGKSSKAAIEKVLRDYFQWRPGYSPFSEETPLIVLHISDHDFDGEAVIGPTFGEQCRRYTRDVYEARVGIKPEDIREAGYDWQDKWYTVKVSNKGYQRWAEQKALFLAECSGCGHMWAAKSKWENPGDLEYLLPEDDPEYFLRPHHCPKCGLEAYEIDPKEDAPHGFEVEAMRTRDYYGLIVNALLEVLPFEFIVERLRDECRANAGEAAERIAKSVMERNRDYQALLREFDRLEEIKAQFEAEVKDWVQSVGEPLTGHFRDDDDDPEEDDYRGHVIGASDWTEPWRPFSAEERTQSLVELLQYRYNEIAAFGSKRIEWER